MYQYWMELNRIHVLRKCCHKQISFLFVKRCQIVSFYTRSRRKLRYVYRCHFVCIQTCKIGKMYSALRHLQVFTHLALIIEEIKVCGLGFLQHMVPLPWNLIITSPSFKFVDSALWYFRSLFNGSNGGRFITKRLNYYYKLCFMLKCPQYLLSDLKSNNIFRCFSEIC